MKVKFSKKLLSVILAALMVVTSVPIIGFVAFAEDNALEDPAITEIKNAMDRFETQLATPGMFTNVDVAYDAYVDCQEAMDAYTYGGETNALDGKASALNTAIDNITAFSGVTGNAVPSFEGDSTPTSNYPGVAYNNILYTTQTTSANEKTSGEIANVYHRVYYPSETTLLYDGSADALMPVMGMASVNSGKTRYIYTSYPSASTSDASDNPNFKLQGYWHDGGGETLDFGWTWAQNTNGPGYSSTVLGDTSHRSSKLDYNTGVFGIFQSGKTKYIANVMKYTGTPASTYSTYDLAWRVTSGDSPNSDSGFIDATGNKIIVVNYKTLLDAVSAAGSKMKAVDLAQFTEGGLIEYIDAMEAATEFDPNAYFTSSNDYVGCSNAIAAAANLVTNAPVDKVNSSDYAALRTAMSSAVMNTYKGGNTGYTDTSWEAFANAYVEAQNIMAAVNENGYVNPSGAAAAATALTDAFGKLELNITRVDATEIMNIIDTFESYNSSYFTTDSYAAVTEEVNLAKAGLWGSVENYGVATALPEDTPENQALVDSYVQQVNDAVKKLVISTSAVVAISNGHRYSLAEAYELTNGLNSSDYANYGQLATAISNAKAYEATLATTEFTDLTAQLEEYTTYVNAIVEAYEALEYSFTRIPDGTTTGVVQSSIKTLEQHRNDNGYNYYVDFSYPGAVTVFRTSHEAKTITYGQADTTFRINIDNNISMENNALDSITINGTADANGDVTVSGAFTGTPPALSDEQKATYAGCLSNNGVSLTNFRIVDMVNNGTSRLGTMADGTEVQVREPENDAYTTILGTTDGANAFPIRGGVFVKPSKEGDASTTLAADMNYDFPATQALELSASTVPKKTVYSYSGYFGATYAWNVQPSSQYAGYSYMTSKSNNQSILSTINVIDISYLVDLVNMCNELAAQSNMYTELSWANLLSNLEAAQANLAYGSMTADSILTNVVRRYNNLWNAYTKLEVKDVNVTFNYKDASGKDDSSVFTVKYGTTLNDIAAQIQAIEVPSYSADGYTFTFKEWSPALDYGTAVTADTTFTATYDSAIDLASWDYYISKLTALRDAVSGSGDILVTSDKLMQLQEVFDLNTTELTYYKAYVNNEYSNIYADQQDAINAEADYIATLMPADDEYIDISVALSAVMIDDPDQYDAQVIQQLKDNMLDNIQIGKNTYEGVNYVNQDALDIAVDEALETAMQYDVYVNDVKVDTFNYGDVVTVDGNGQVITDGVTPTDEVFAWTGYYAAPSLGENENPEYDYNISNEKYLTNSPTYTFVVKGDTYLSAVDSKADDSICMVTIKNNVTGFISDIFYVNTGETIGNKLEENKKNIACYTFDNFYNAPTGGEVVTSETVVNSDMTVYARYAVKLQLEFEIGAYNSEDAFWNYSSVDAIIPEGTIYEYNELVTVASDLPDFGAWVKVIDPNAMDIDVQIVSYDKDYSFYACEDILLFPITQSQVESGKLQYTNLLNHSSNSFDPSTDNVQIYANTQLVPIYTSTDEFEKFSMIGNYAVPDGYKVLEKGFLINTNPDTDVLPEDFVVTNESLNRIKVIHLTDGNQFVLNVKGVAPTTPVDYCAYAVVEGPDGTRTEIYSNIVSNASAE